MLREPLQPQNDVTVTTLLPPVVLFIFITCACLGSVLHLAATVPLAQAGAAAVQRSQLPGTRCSVLL